MVYLKNEGKRAIPDPLVTKYGALPGQDSDRFPCAGFDESTQTRKSLFVADKVKAKPFTFRHSITLRCIASDKPRGGS